MPALNCLTMSGQRKSLMKALLPCPPALSLSRTAKMTELVTGRLARSLATSSRATTPLPLSLTPGLVVTVSQWAQTTTATKTNKTDQPIQHYVVILLILSSFWPHLAPGKIPRTFKPRQRVSG